MLTYTLSHWVRIIVKRHIDSCCLWWLVGCQDKHSWNHCGKTWLLHFMVIILIYVQNLAGYRTPCTFEYIWEQNCTYTVLSFLTALPECKEWSMHLLGHPLFKKGIASGSYGWSVRFNVMGRDSQSKQICPAKRQSTRCLPGVKTRPPNQTALQQLVEVIQSTCMWKYMHVGFKTLRFSFGDTTFCATTTTRSSVSLSIELLKINKLTFAHGMNQAWVGMGCSDMVERIYRGHA